MHKTQLGTRATLIPPTKITETADFAKKNTVQTNRSVYVPPYVRCDFDNYEGPQIKITPYKCCSNETKFIHPNKFVINSNTKTPLSESTSIGYDSEKKASETSASRNSQTASNSPYLTTYTQRLLNLRGSTVSHSSKYTKQNLGKIKNGFTIMQVITRIHSRFNL